MELKFSGSGIPFIDFDDDGGVFETKTKVRLIFAKLTSSDTNFKYVVVKGFRSTISGKKRIPILERENFLADIHLNGFPKGFTGDECHNFTKHRYTFLRKVFRKYVIEHEDGDYIPLESIKKIAKDLTGYKEPKRRLKKKVVRKSKKAIHLTDETIAKMKAKKAEEEKKAAEKEKKVKERENKKREKEVKKIEKELNGKKKRKRKAKPKEMGKTCKSCKKELFTVPSCNTNMIIGHNKRWMPIVHKGRKPCKACGVLAGGRHHLYCPHEICPRCKGKFAKCGCF